MEYNDKEFCLEVWGDNACFTRPEMKVERVSYDVITPSSARSIFEAIFWKPAIRWQVTRIEVLNPIQWQSVRRNEIGSTMSHRSDGLFIEDKRQQKAGLLLKDVRYRIYAKLVFIPLRERNTTQAFTPTPDHLVTTDEKNDLRKEENPGKYNAMFERRARKGQCFNQPYLGCREFSANFELVEKPSEVSAINETRDLGFMLYDMDFTKRTDPQAMFYRAKMENGVINVPPVNSEEVLR